MSTKQGIAQRNFDITGCSECEHFKDTTIFRLCTHTSSAFKYDDKEEFHTIQHMREEYAPCGLDKKHYKGKQIEERKASATVNAIR
jgi:hypothetical protein